MYSVVQKSETTLHLCNFSGDITISTSVGDYCDCGRCNQLLRLNFSSVAADFFEKMKASLLKVMEAVIKIKSGHSKY